MSKFVFHVSSFVPTLSDCHCKLEWEISANYCVSGELDVPIKAYDISQILFGLMTRQLNFNLIYRQTKFKTVYPNLTIYQIQQNQTSVDDAAAELSNIFISAATM